MNKKVSVIIPTYKRAEYLTRAINSILMQTYKNIEIIVVDDNDPDTIFRTDNEKIMKKFITKKNVIYIKHDKNKNGAAARNTGISVATGDYITFLDDDDYFLPNRIEKLADILDSNLDYDGAYTNVFIKVCGSLTNEFKGGKSGNLAYELLCQESFFATGSNIFLRREAVLKTGKFDEQFIRHQDIEYMIRFFDNHNILYVDDTTVVKNNNDIINKLNYEKLLSVKELFFQKFSSNILKYDVKKIYYNNYYELYYLTFNSKQNKNYILDKLVENGGNRIKLELKYLIKKIIVKFVILKKMQLIFKKIKNYKQHKELINYEHRLAKKV